MNKRTDIEDEIKSIVNNDPPNIKIGDYITIILPTGGVIVGGLIMAYNVYKFDHPDLLIPAIIAITISFLILIISLRKLKKESTYECVITKMTREENTILSKEILQKLFKGEKIYEFDEGIIFIHFESFLSWGKQITFVPIDNKIFYNFCDLHAPYSIISRDIYMNKIKKMIKENSPVANKW